MAVTLRPARASDAEELFAWRNDLYLVSRSSTGRGVSWEEHAAWLIRTLADSDRCLLVIAVDGREGGAVRFDRRAPGEAVISVYLLGPLTGRGAGVDAIRQGCLYLQEAWGPTAVIAHVRDDNEPGRRAFAKAGFRPIAQDAGCPAGHSTFRRESRP
ncbi:MAG: GNAT family N-acetyltransferase [Magnetospirillum sp. WYHS-4]